MTPARGGTTWAQRLVRRTPPRRAVDLHRWPGTFRESQAILSAAALRRPLPE
jgi:hypothetical protein